MKDEYGARSDTSAVYKMPDRDVDAVVKTAYALRFQADENPYYRGSFSVLNDSDPYSELGALYPLPGDKIRLDIREDEYEKVKVNAFGRSGNDLGIHSLKFAMPSEMTVMTVSFFYKPLELKVVNRNPERGTVYLRKDAYRPGEKVIVQFKANSGYSFNTNSLYYIDRSKSKPEVVKITKDSDGKYSFIMPFSKEIEVYGLFVTKENAQKASNPAIYEDATTYVDEEEEPEETAEPEEPAPEEIDVTPIVAAVVAETVMAAVTTTVRAIAACL